MGEGKSFLPLVWMTWFIVLCPFPKTVILIPTQLLHEGGFSSFTTIFVSIDFWNHHGCLGVGLGTFSSTLPGFQERVFVLLHLTFCFVTYLETAVRDPNPYYLSQAFFCSQNHATFFCMYYIPKGYKVRYKVTSQL